MKHLIVLALSVAALSSGCASIVNGHNQSLSVATLHQGQPVTDANCKLSNDKGVWFLKTPGSTTVRRSYENLAVACEKPGLDAGLTSAKSSTKAMAFGNILFGGIIGVGVDTATGAAYDYPDLITVEMSASPLAVPAVIAPVVSAPAQEIKVSN